MNLIALRLAGYPADADGIALITGDVLEAEVIISAMLHHPDSTSTLQAASKWLDSAKRRRDSMPFEVRRG